MTDRNQVAPQAGAEASDPHADAGPGTAMPTRERLRRLAGLVANGEIALTSAAREFSPEDCRQLETHVRDLLRDRLARFIALQIAWDIRSERDHAQREREQQEDRDRGPTSEHSL